MDDTSSAQNNTVPSAEPQGSPRRSHKLLWIAVLVAALLLVAGGLWVWWQSDNPPASQQGRQSQVVIAAHGLSPTTIKIKRGQSVTWVNNDSIAHRLAAANATDAKTAGFDSDGQLSTGDSFTYTFDASGTFAYRDPASPVTFNGVVIVE